MEIHVHHHHYIHGSPAEASKLDQILAAVLRLTDTVQTTGEKTLADISAQLEKLRVGTERIETVSGSVVNLVNGMGTMITDLKAQLAQQGIPPEQLTALDDFGNRLVAAAQPMADAVVAHTPAA